MYCKIREMSRSKEKTGKQQATKITGEGYRVLLFNDDVHTMDEVVLQLVKALSCTVEEAVAVMLRAHEKGITTVIITTKGEANRVAGILREIGLRVDVEQV